MTWVRRAEPPSHACAPPTREVTHAFRLPSLSPGVAPAALEHTVTAVDGKLGDLWRCDGCGHLWRVARACDACEYYGPGRHAGQCMVGLAWRPASLMQRLRNRRLGLGTVTHQ